MLLKTASQSLQNPLDQLSQWLDSDMAAVNDEILRRMESPVALIPQLARYLIAAGGKRIRPLLTLASTSLYSGNMSRAHSLAAAVEFIHTATLLHDDVVDESQERRGQAAANLVFGNQASVLVGDFLFARAFELMTDNESIQILRILSRASAIIAEGEVMQLSHKGNSALGLEDYLEIVKAKTAALFSAACEVGPVIAGADQSAERAMADYGLNLGIAFQIADDALDYHADQKKLGKIIGDDFREGKMTAPVIFALKNADTQEKEFWCRVIERREQEPQDLIHAQDLMKKHQAIEASIALAHTFATRAQEALKDAPNHKFRSVLGDLCLYAISRES